MKPPPFAYAAPRTLEEALELMGEHGAEARPLAGGQSLVPMLNFRLARPAVLVDLNDVEGLERVEEDGDGRLRLGAMARLASLERHPGVGHRAPLLTEALPHVAHPPIRSRGTVGGSLAHADPAAELPAVARVLDARLRVASVRGERTVDAAAFFVGPYQAALEPDELLVGVEIPPFPAGAGFAFEELARRHGDYALLGVAAAVTLDGTGACATARLAFVNAALVAGAESSAAGPALAGEAPTEERIREAARAAAGELDPPGDVHATPEYRRRLAAVLSRRALARAFARCGGGGTVVRAG